MRVSAKLYGNIAFPITVNFDTGKRSLSVSDARKLARDLIETAEWVESKGAKNTEQLLQPENGPIKCANKGCAGWDNGFCAMPGLCREGAVSG